MKLTLNISPCPNDTFMFDAIVNKRIDTGDLDFEVSYFDIEELNRRAMDGGADITKVSCAVIPAITGRYAVCDSGSALGVGNGPLIVARSGNGARIRAAIAKGVPVKLAVPGMHTTANLLMERLFPRVQDKTAVLFSEIADRVSAGDFDAGVLIHEGRFTYAAMGLELVWDLGLRWEEATGLPLPLGAIAALRSLPHAVAAGFDRLLAASIRYALDDPTVSRPFVKSHAREMDDKVIDSHIALFVNEYSLSLGEGGRRAIAELTGLDSGIFL